jgi:hypothetical protein
METFEVSMYMSAIFFKPVKYHSPLYKSATVADEDIWNFKGESSLLLYELKFHIR